MLVEQQKIGTHSKRNTYFAGSKRLERTRHVLPKGSIGVESEAETDVTWGTCMPAVE